MGSDYPTEANAVLRMKVSNSKLRGGAALMLALWALFLLSAMIISWALDINSRLVVSGNASRVLDAEAMASSGAEVALTREISPSSPNLHRQMGSRQSYDVQMTGECGRLNLNFLIQGEDPTKLAILRQYLTLKGVELNNLDTMMDSLLDWVSPGKGIHHLNACPETDDYRPPHSGQLFSLDELKEICGWANFTSKPAWDEDFAIIPSPCTQIDLAWASRDVLRALGIGDDRVDRFLQLRQGPDGIDGTADDPQLDQPTAFATLGLNLPQNQQPPALAQGLIGFKNPQTQVFRVVSVGKSGDVSRFVQMIVSKQTGINGARVMSWKEL
jgi:hypothetical protein